MAVTYQALHLHRTVHAPVETTWEAFRDTESRTRWGTPPGEEQTYLEDDFRPGGIARYICGPAGAPEFTGKSIYLQVLPQRLIVHTDTVWHGDYILATAILTWRFEPSGEHTLVRVIDHVASFVGPEMIEGHRNGHQSALAQLQEFLRPAPQPT